MAISTFGWSGSLLFALYLTEYLDEFVIKMINSYQDKQFMNVCDKSLDIETEEEKKEIEEVNTTNKEMLDEIKEVLKDKVKEVRFTNTLKNIDEIYYIMI